LSIAENESSSSLPNVEKEYAPLFLGEKDIHAQFSGMELVTEELP